ncbi:MAG: HAMP domain-containing protein [Carboxydocellales bacterium]
MDQFDFKFKNLQQRLTVIFFLLMIISLIISTLIFYINAKNSLTNQLRAHLTNLAKTSAQMIDVEKHNKLKKVEDEKTPEYQELKGVLQKIRDANPGIRDIYTVIKTDKPGIWQFILDGEEDPKLVSHIGATYQVEKFPEMQKAFSEASADNGLTKDEWGYYLSGYAPIKDKTGKTVAMIGLDFSAEGVIKEESQITMVAELIILFGSLMSWYFCRKIANGFYIPILILINATRRIANNDFDCEIPVKRRDEFGQLAISFNEMARRLKEYDQKLSLEVLEEKEQKRQILKVYKDVMFAVSQGKFVLMEDDEIDDYLNTGEVIAEQSIARPIDVGECRSLVEKILLQYSMEPKTIRHTVLAISEGATNILKHAETGKLIVMTCDGVLKLVLSDSGSGMPYDKIPYMVFFTGFSTKISLGFGFSIMYQCADRLILQTSGTGTRIILEKAIAKHSKVNELLNSKVS